RCKRKKKALPLFPPFVCVAGQPELAASPAGNIPLRVQLSRPDHGPNALSDRMLARIKPPGPKFHESLAGDHCRLLPTRAREPEDELVDLLVRGGAHPAARNAVSVIRACHLGIDASGWRAIEEIALDFFV